MSNEVGRIDNFRALARKLSFLPTELDIFDIPQHYEHVIVFYLSFNVLFVEFYYFSHRQT